VKKGKAALTRILTESNENLINKLMGILQDAEPAPDYDLPRTGVSLEWERRLSPLFIQSDNYGTRSSTVLLLSKKDMQYTERIFNNGTVADQHFTIALK